MEREPFSSLSARSAIRTYRLNNKNEIYSVWMLLQQLKQAICLLLLYSLPVAGMQNDIRDVSETLSSHHPFVSVFPDQMTLIIG